MTGLHDFFGRVKVGSAVQLSGPHLRFLKISRAKTSMENKTDLVPLKSDSPPSTKEAILFQFTC